MLKLSLIIFFNILFLPIYICALILCFIFTFIPLYPVISTNKNLRYRLNLIGFKNRIFMTKVFMNYMLYLIEMIFFDSIRLSIATCPKNFNLVDFLTKTKDFYSDKIPQGFTFLAGHVANIESHNLPIIEAYKKLNQGKVIGLAKPSRSPLINKIFVLHRVKKGVGMLWTNKDIFENMNKAIDNGDSLCLISDQKPKKNGTFISFFGRYAAFPTKGMEFCAEKKSIFIYAFAHRIIPGWSEVTFERAKNLHLIQTTIENNLSQDLYQNNILPADIYKSKIKKDVEDKAIDIEMSYFVKWLEENIKKHPAQWCWDYRKWSRFPI